MLLAGPREDVTREEALAVLQALKDQGHPKQRKQHVQNHGRLYMLWGLGDRRRAGLAEAQSEFGGAAEGDCTGKREHEAEHLHILPAVWKWTCPARSPVCS